MVTLLSAAGLALCTVVAATQSTLNLWLRSNWDAPPLILEALESAAIESPEVYFPLLSLLTSQLPLIESGTPQQQLEAVYGIIVSSNIIQEYPTWDFSTFKASLALHEAAPKIQAYYQYYNTAVNETSTGTNVGTICETWVEWRGKGFCDVEELKKDMESALSGAISELVTLPQLLPFDHIYPQAYISSPHPPAILYMTTLSSAQADLYEYLMHHAKADDSFEVIVRYRPLPPRIAAESEHIDINKVKNSLKGYGVELVLKKTDYLAVDDRDTGHVQDTNAQQVQQATIKSTDGITSVLGAGSWQELVDKPLKLGEITDLGLKTASLILASNDPLQALKEVSQDFPKHSAAIARRIDLNHSVVEEVAGNQQKVQLKETVWINGRVFSGSEMNAHELLASIREERHLMLSLTSLGLTADQAFKLLTDSSIAAAITVPDPMEGMVDASDKLEGGGVITWWNDLEKDKRYASWPTSVAALARPGRQGPFQQVKRNFWHLVLALDMSKTFSVATVSQTIQQMVKRGIPFRVGIVPLISENAGDDSVKMGRLIGHIIVKHGRAQAMEFMQTLARTTPQPTLDLRVVETIYNAKFGALAKKQETELETYADIVDGKVTGLSTEKTLAWLRRMALTPATASMGGVFLNGKYRDLHERWTETMMQDYTNQLNFLMQPGVVAELKAAPKLSRFFYDLPLTATRRNLHIAPDDFGKQRIVDMRKAFKADSPLLKQFVYPAQSEEKEILLTKYIVGDLDSQDGRDLCRSALEHLKSEETLARVGFWHVPSHKSSYHHPLRLSTFLYQAYSSAKLSDLTPADLLEVLNEIEATVDQTAPKLGRIWDSVAQAQDDYLTDSVDASIYHSPVILSASRQFWDSKVGESQTISFGTGSLHIIANGRIIGPLTSDEFEAADFQALERFEAKMRALPVANALAELTDMSTDLTRFDTVEMINHISAVIGQGYSTFGSKSLHSPVVPRARVYELLDGRFSSFQVCQAATSLVNIYAVIDPVSEQAQKWSSLLEMVSKLDNTSIKIQLNPALALSEIPVKRFYRYEAATELRFSADGTESLTGASFRDLPEDPILTLGMDVPNSWLVRPKGSIHDLDNLRLSSILPRQGSPVIDIRFELEQLAIEGYASEVGPGEVVPRGLELQLSTVDNSVVGDTSVMANVGYFQFKVNPGLYQLGIREGRGRDIYQLDKEASQLFVTSFRGTVTMPSFMRKAGMETADVLQVVPPSTNIVSKLFNSLSTVIGRKRTPAVTHADINIFTVASGKLYERFASIMMLSVLQHTESTVKFWFIENFLSPSFLEFLPHFAAEHGFQYELVTYKWPSWLRSQKEKQREIWGYKILFLDVLFPLDLDKVIFVDADQIVRTDMKSLVDLDLQGRVYGMAPMGDDKPEMEGFRFWKTGYWKDALRGKPYHISALYVVDLKAFRRAAAGDRLRATYQALSADPNSLANLDQDLPNSMQEQLPIFTLDQSWLWCETWCSQESLANAKTIDLCQNPLTKQPKLERAKQIPEWEVYDKRVDDFARKLAERQSGAEVVTGSAADIEGLLDTRTPGGDEIHQKMNEL